MAFVTVTSNREAWLKEAIVTSKAFTSREVVINLNKMLKKRWQRLNRQQFKAEGRGASGKWDQLSPDYAERKAKKYPGKTILRRTDRLFRAATGRKENIIRGSNIKGTYSWRFKILVPYSKFHQNTRFNPPPTRKIFDPDAKQQRGITAAIGRTIVQGLFERDTFDNRRGTPIVFKNTGFDRVEI